MRENAYVELKFAPNLELIPIVRRFVSAFYQQLLGHEDLAARMALATHELLENTVKFSSDGASAVHIGVETLADSTEIVIRTRNRTRQADRDTAMTIVGEMKAAGDAFAYYQSVMRKNAKRTDGSGLGLARICAEAEMTLDYELVGDEIAMVARATLPGAAGGTEARA